MPELPEVETVRRVVARGVVGRRVAAAWVRPPDRHRLMVRPDAPTFKRATEGVRILSIERYGKQLDFPLDNGWHLLIHLGMTGRLELHQASGSLDAMEHPRHVWAALQLEPDPAIAHDLLIYRDPRRFGVVEVAERPDFRARMGVDPFDERFDPRQVALAIGKRRAPIKMVLLDQRIIAGLGSIYADELCFAAGIHPETRACDVPAERLAALVAEIRPMLERAIAGEGARLDRSPYQDLFGRVGTFNPRAYGRGGKPCVACGTPMQSARVGEGRRGRSYAYCPACQPPLASGETTAPGRD